MKKDVVRLALIAVLLTTATIVGAGYYLRAEKKERKEQEAKQPPPEASLFVRPHSRSLGPKDAKVTVVEFLDPECESCRAMYPIVKQLLQQYAGRMRLVVRYMPFHPSSYQAASALESAGAQGRYWDMLEIMFREQPRWGSHHAPKPELIPELAEQIGLDMGAFRHLLGSPAHRVLVDADQADGKVLGVTGTPTFFVNGRLLDRLGYESLSALIEEELAK